MANLTIKSSVLDGMSNNVFFSSFWNNRREILSVINDEAIAPDQKRIHIKPFLPPVSEAFDFYIYRKLFNPRIFDYNVEEFDNFTIDLNNLIENVEKLRVIYYNNQKTRASYTDTFERTIVPTADYSAESRNNPQFEDTIVTGLQYR